MLVVVLDGLLFPRHGGARLSVATFPVARWVVAVIRVVPAGERLSKFFENSLTRLRMQVTVAFVVFQLRFQLGFIGYLTVLIPSALDVVASDVPQF